MNRIRRIGILSVMLALVGLVGWFDRSTGPEYGTVLLFLIPIAGTSLYLDRAAMIAVSAVSGIVWLAADVERAGTTLPVLAWNEFTTLTVFFLVGLAIVRIREDRERVAELAARLHVMLDREAAAARRDPLTDLPNLRQFHEHLELELARRRRDGGALSVLYIDLDGFKAINDANGHAAGDEVLRRVAAILRGSIRAGDLAARVGGDEFVILLSGNSAPAELIARRLRERIEGLGDESGTSGLSASIGVAVFDPVPDQAEDVLKEADARMYRDKALRAGSLEMRRTS